MVRIDVDYNERDSDGHVVARVPEGQLTHLRVEQRVSLYDPIDHLWADASVAWIDPNTGAVGFEVDWTSFADGDLTEPQEPVTTLLLVYSQLRTRVNVELISEPSASLSFTGKDFSAPSTRRIFVGFSKLFTGRREGRHHIAPKNQVFNYAIRLVRAEQERSSSSSDVELSAGWELTHP